MNKYESLDHPIGFSLNHQCIGSTMSTNRISYYRVRIAWMGPKLLQHATIDTTHKLTCETRNHPHKHRQKESVKETHALFGGKHGHRRWPAEEAEKPRRMREPRDLEDGDRRAWWSSLEVIRDKRWPRPWTPAWHEKEGKRYICTHLYTMLKYYKHMLIKSRPKHAYTRHLNAHKIIHTIYISTPARIY